MDYYRRIAFEPDEPIREVPDSVYLDKMEKILSAYPSIGVPPEPSNITGSVFVGTQANAENPNILKAYHINFLVNCSASSGTKVGYRRTRERFGPMSGVEGYIELGATESEFENIRSHFDRVFNFIAHVRNRGGRVLIYCPGVSTSGAIAIAFLMHTHVPLLEATKILKDKRRVALCNNGFMAQLVSYARQIGMLDLDASVVRAPKYFRPLNKRRIMSAHLPMFV